MAELANKQIVLEELRRVFDGVYAASDALDAKLTNLLNFSSLIVSFAATIQIATLESKVGVAFWALLGIALLLYLVNFLWVKSGLRPRTYRFSMSGDKDTIIDKYFAPPQGQVLNEVIGNYLGAIETAKTFNDQKATAIAVANYLLVAIVIALLLAVPLGLIFPTPTLPDFLKSIH
jgi:hypothetical protein